MIGIPKMGWKFWQCDNLSDGRWDTCHLPVFARSLPPPMYTSGEPRGRTACLGLGIVHCGSSEKGVEVFVFINELCFVEKVFNNHWYSMERKLFVLNLGHLIDVATGVKGKSTKCPRSGIV